MCSLNRHGRETADLSAMPTSTAADQSGEPSSMEAGLTSRWRWGYLTACPEGRRLSAFGVITRLIQV